MDDIRKLHDQITQAMNSEDEIDRTYLLEAVQADLLQIHEGRAPVAVQDLIDNPVS